MGGGGSSGGVSFPTYIENFHDDLIGSSTPSGVSGFVTLEDAMGSAFGNDPYTGITPATTGHLEETIDRWPGDVQAPIQDLDAVADWKSQIQDAVTEIINNNLLDNLDPHANLAGNAESGADTNITKAKNSVNTGVSPETDWESFVDTTVAKIRGQLQDAELDLGAIEPAIRQASDSEIEDALAAALDQVGVTPSNDWQSFADAVQSKADESGFFVDAEVDLSSIEAAIRTASDNEIADALTAALGNVGVDPESDWGALADKVQTKVDSSGFLNDANVDLSAIESSIENASDSEVSTALAAALDNVGVSPQTDWADKVDTAIAKVDSGDVLKDIDMASVIQAAEVDATRELQTALNEAEKFVKSNLIDPVVSEFEQKVNDRLDKRKRSVSSLYADVNATHSSAFLISQALLEREAQREINEFDAETRLEMYREAFQGHLQNFGQTIQARAQEEIQESEQRVQFITQGAELMAQILGQKVQFEQAVTQLHTQTYTDRMGLENQNRVEMESLNKQSRDQILSQQIDTLTEVFLRKIGFEETVTQLHAQNYDGRLQAETQARTETETLNKQTRDQFVNDQLNTVAQILSDKLGFERSVVQNHVQAYRNRLSDEASSRTQLRQQREQTINQGIQNITEILARKIQYEQTFMELHVEAFARRLQAYLEAEARNKQSDDQLVGQGVKGMLETSRNDAQLLIQERQAAQQAAAADFEARQQAEEFSTSLDEKSALWELTVHETGSNILAAPSGMAARVPPQKSDASKAVGGALQGAATGASIGSAVPGIGNAVGAGIGALLGATSGAL